MGPAWVGTWSGVLLDGIMWGATVFVGAHQLILVLIFVIAICEARRSRRFADPETLRAARESGELPGITVVVAAHNEAVSIVDTVRSILALDYPQLEVIVVNDGSTDPTLSTLWSEFRLWPSPERVVARIPTSAVRSILASEIDPRLRVFDKRNGGKADAVNVGINAATFPLVCVTDADVRIERSALARLALAFVEREDTVAAGGMIRLLPGNARALPPLREVELPRTLLERLQVLEYTRSFSLGRLAFNHLGHLIVSGAFGLFRRETLFRVGGYQPLAIGEDIELVARIHRTLGDEGVPYRVVFAGEAVCFTDPPHTVVDLGRQRTRWHQGLLTTLRLYATMLFRRRYGSVGLFAMPYYLLFELLAPVIEACGWLVLLVGGLAGVLAPASCLAFLLTTILLAPLVSLVAVTADAWSLGYPPRARDRLGLVLCAFLEGLGYRQLTVYWRVRAFWAYFRSIHLRGGWTSPRRQRAGRPGRSGIRSALWRTGR
jgi:cellulose synthase/poly-beta-1,6-N-acetylglucosamine synthase-like glycosyltransferase